jgi:hypothetical protein
VRVLGLRVKIEAERNATAVEVIGYQVLEVLPAKVAVGEEVGRRGER